MIIWLTILKMVSFLEKETSLVFVSRTAPAFLKTNRLSPTAYCEDLFPQMHGADWPST